MYFAIPALGSLLQSLTASQNHLPRLKILHLDWDPLLHPGESQFPGHFWKSPVVETCRVRGITMSGRLWKRACASEALLNLRPLTLLPLALLPLVQPVVGPQSEFLRSPSSRSRSHESLLAPVRYFAMTHLVAMTLALSFTVWLGRRRLQRAWRATSASAPAHTIFL